MLSVVKLNYYTTEIVVQCNIGRGLLFKGGTYLKSGARAFIEGKTVFEKKQVNLEIIVETISILYICLPIVLCGCALLFVKTRLNYLKNGVLSIILNTKNCYSRIKWSNQILHKVSLTTHIKSCFCWYTLQIEPCP